MSIESFFGNLFKKVQSEAPVIAAAYDKLDAMAGIVLGLGQVVVDAADPALVPVVTPLMAAVTSARAAAKAAVDSTAADIAASTLAVSNLTTAVVNLGVAAAPGIKAVSNIAAAT